MGQKSDKKLISIVVPVYNEQECLEELYRRTSAVMDGIAEYETELVFFDDGSTDASRAMIEGFCEQDSRCKAVFLETNCGYNSIIFYAMQQAKGDGAVLLHADLQNPPELIPDFINEWEKGHDAVFGVKNKSRENKGMFALRTLAYWSLNIVFGMKLIPHATDFELVDKSILASLKGHRRGEPILRVLLSERAKAPQLFYYTQDRRVAGKSNFTLGKYYRLALSWINASSNALPRRVLCTGLVMFLLCLVELFAGFLPHIREWTFASVSTPLLIRLALIVLSVLICFEALVSELLLNNKQEWDIPKENKRIKY